MSLCFFPPIMIPKHKASWGNELLFHNDQLNVINKDGKCIKNLYAAGEILGFGNTSGHGFVGGMSLTPAMTFGKILGENILKW